MPLLDAHVNPGDWFDPDSIPRTAVTIGTSGVVVDRLAHHELSFHRHRKGQLMLSLRGVISCEIEGALWVVPPHSALWVPGEVLHRITAAGTVEGYVLFVDPRATSDLPARACAIQTTPLLRELLVRAARLPILYPEGGMESRLVALLLDEIAAAPTKGLHLRLPADARLRKIAMLIARAPAERGTLQTWARRVAVSERTLARLLVRETGMSFGRWRQQLQLMLAMQWLADGASVARVAEDLGYESTGSFVTMFRKALGTSPARYIAERRLPAG